MAQLNDPVRLEQITLGNPNAAESEVVEYSKKSVGVWRRHSDEKVDVTREARVTMKCHRVAANNEIVNVVRIQQFDELSQIGLQLRQECSGAVPRAREGCRAVPGASRTHKTGRPPSRHLQNCR